MYPAGLQNLTAKPPMTRLGGWTHGDLVEGRSLEVVVEEVADRDQQLPVGAGEGLQERQALREPDVEAGVA